jgi:hypothetical protein
VHFILVWLLPDLLANGSGSGILKKEITRYDSLSNKCRDDDFSRAVADVQASALSRHTSFGTSSFTSAAPTSCRP